MVNVSQARAGDFASGGAAVLKIYSVILVTTFAALAASFLFSRSEIFFGTLALFAFLIFFALQVILLASADHYLKTALILNSLAWAVFFYGALSLYFVITFG